MTDLLITLFLLVMTLGLGYAIRKEALRQSWPRRGRLLILSAFFALYPISFLVATAAYASAWRTVGAALIPSVVGLIWLGLSELRAGQGGARIDH